MKDIIITAKRRKIEIITYLICFLMAFLINVHAIIRYQTPWIELFTSIGFVLVASVILYVAWTFIRIIIYGLKSVLKKSK